MVSRLAKETVGKWKSEGLEPTFEDCIRLNALGLKVERGPSAYEFGAVPRMAFLGDYVFTEPTVAKRMWMESAMALMEDDYSNQLCLTAFALNCPPSELPDLNNVPELVQAVRDFRDEVLSRYTETQIVTCIEYALRGDGQEEHEGTGTNVNSEEDVSELPDCARSVARQVMAEALSYGMDADVKYEATLPQLERMVMLAALHSGTDVLKGEHGQAVGAFYSACGKIRERLLKERQQEKQNGQG